MDYNPGNKTNIHESILMKLTEKMGEKGQTLLTEKFQLLNVETMKKIESH